MGFIQAIRYPAFCVISLASLIVLALDAHLTSVAQNAPQTSMTKRMTSVSHVQADTNDISLSANVFEKIGLAASVLTTAIVVVFVILDRKKSHPTIGTEIGWLGMLSILWTVTLCLAAAHTCTTGCQETEASLAFTVVTWVTLNFYLVVLAAFSCFTSKKGNKHIWETRVRDLALVPREDDPEKASTESQA